MECPFCYTNFEYHLSICTSCGKDTDDPLYQELFSRVKPRKIGQSTATTPDVTAYENNSLQMKDSKLDVPPTLAILGETVTPAREKGAITTEIARSKDTCKTLMDFPNKQPEIPEWRRELQSKIKEIQGQRQSADAVATTAVEAIPAKRHAIGGTGLAMAVIETPKAKASPLVEKALARIEQSRIKNEPVEQKAAGYTGNYQPLSFQPSVPAQPAPPLFQPLQPTQPAAPVRTFEPVKRTPRAIPFPEESSFGDVKPFVFSEGETVESRLPVIEQKFKEKLAQAAEMRNELMLQENFTTSKLRKQIVVDIEDEFFEVKPIEKEAAPAKTVAIQEIEEIAVTQTEIETAAETDDNINEEIAPFVYRFNAGFFDLIISSFLSLILLSPFMMLSGNWLSLQGALAFIVTCSIVMFLYITASVGMIGRTLGMNLFSLEMIDAEDNDYPTFHQAAVSASIYQVSLLLGGIGFATMFWNEDRRAVHDLASGTIVVREV